jgi:hypothetical protein
MSVSVDTYDDFKTVTDALKANRIVFFTQPTPESFQVAGFPDHGIDGVILSFTSGASKPATFDADFPHAIALETFIGLT